MAARTENIPGNELFKVLQQAKLDLDALKQRQRTSAQSGVLGYAVQSANTWDVQTTIGLDADTTTRVKDVFIDYVGDGSQDIAFANLSYTVFVNGTDSAHELT